MQPGANGTCGHFTPAGGNKGASQAIGEKFAECHRALVGLEKLPPALEIPLVHPALTAACKEDQEVVEQPNPFVPGVSRSTLRIAQGPGPRPLSLQAFQYA